MKNIAIISEGRSETSRLIAENVKQTLQKTGYLPEIIYIGEKTWLTQDNQAVDKNDFSLFRNGKKITFDCVYIYSEAEVTKGWIQGYLSMLKIPYISSSPFTTMLATNKYFCKQVLEQIGILTPKSIKVGKKESLEFSRFLVKIGFPCIVKPNIGTDSILIVKATNEQELRAAVVAIQAVQQEVLIEEFIEGRDMTCGVILIKGQQTPTPVTEIIVPQGDFYSYDVKINRNNQKVTPAHIPSQLAKNCQDISVQISKELNCDGFIRIDYILRENRFYFLEVNITPGLSPRGNFPLQLAAMNIKLEELYTSLIEEKSL